MWCKQLLWIEDPGTQGQASCVDVGCRALPAAGIQAVEGMESRQHVWCRTMHGQTVLPAAQGDVWPTAADCQSLGMVREQISSATTNGTGK